MNNFYIFIAILLGVLNLLQNQGVEGWSRRKRQYEVIQEAEDVHNNYRKEEGASNMNKVTWDKTLAEAATKWAENCDFKHGQPPSPAFDDYVGQNLYTSTSTKVNWTAIVKSWFDEKGYYTFDTQGCQTGKMCGHYTQVVWADTNKIGCASFACTNLKSTRWTNGLLAVCNYLPAGNYIGEDPYIKGEPCSKCANGCANKLCV